MRKTPVHTSPYLPHLPRNLMDLGTLGRHGAIKFRIPINTSDLNLWLQGAAHAVPRTWRLMNIIALLRGEAQIITYDTLYVQRFMTQSGQAYVWDSAELWGSSPMLRGSSRFLYWGECGGRQDGLSTTWVNGIVQTIDMLNRENKELMGELCWWCGIFSKKGKLCDKYKRFKDFLTFMDNGRLIWANHFLGTEMQVIDKVQNLIDLDTLDFLNNT